MRAFIWYKNHMDWTKIPQEINVQTSWISLFETHCINFRELRENRFFANINFREWTSSEVFAYITFREFDQNSLKQVSPKAWEKKFQNKELFFSIIFFITNTWYKQGFKNNSADIWQLICWHLAICIKTSPQYFKKGSERPLGSPVGIESFLLPASLGICSCVIC